MKISINYTGLNGFQTGKSRARYSLFQDVRQCRSAFHKNASRLALLVISAVLLASVGCEAIATLNSTPQVTSPILIFEYAKSNTPLSDASFAFALVNRNTVETGVRITFDPKLPDDAEIQVIRGGETEPSQKVTVMDPHVVSVYNGSFRGTGGEGNRSVNRIVITTYDGRTRVGIYQKSKSLASAYAVTVQTLNTSGGTFGEPETRNFTITSN